MLAPGFPGTTPRCRNRAIIRRRNHHSRARPAMTETRQRTRVETDSFGPIDVPADRYWGAQTERSRRNFRIGTEHIPIPLIRALAIVKRAAAEVNHELGSLDALRTRAILHSAHDVIH